MTTVPRGCRRISARVVFIVIRGLSAIDETRRSVQSSALRAEAFRRSATETASQDMPQLGLLSSLHSQNSFHLYRFESGNR